MSTLGLEAGPPVVVGGDVGLRQWIVGGLASLALAMLAWWGMAMDARVAQGERHDADTDRRLTVVETQAQQFGEIKATLKDMSQKLDRFIEREQERQLQQGSRRFDR